MKINASITIEKEVLKKGKQVARKEKRSFSSMVELLVDEYCKL